MLKLQNRLLNFVIGGVSVAAGVYLTNAIDLLGATEQIPYVMLGIVAGSLLFSFLSSYIFSRISLLASSAIAIITIASERLYVQSYPLLSNLLIAVLFAGCTSLILPMGRVTRQDEDRKASLIYTYLGSVIIFLAAAGIYLINGYSGLAQIEVGLEIIGLLALLALLLRKRGKYLEKLKKGSGDFGQEATKVTLLLTVPLIFILVLSSFQPALAESQETVTPVKHVVIIMMENHSFDNLFGVYPTDSMNQQPLSNVTAGSLTGQIEIPNNLVHAANLPNLSKVPDGIFVTKDPVEGYIAYHLDWANGSMLGFSKNSGEQAMTYFTSSQLGIEWSIAEQYSLADMYFASQLTETAPNRLFSLAGFSPVINDYGPPPYIPYSQSIFSELDNYGISWGYYVQNPSKGTGTLSYFYGMPKKNLGSWQQFFDEAGNNSLPAVSWLMPVDGGAVGYSQGPPADVLKGQLWLLYVIQKVEESPEWNSTAIFITYDEGGGYYDHVSPPNLMGMQLGERVPMILVSPYAKEDYVSHTVMTHTSLLAFIDYNWRIPALNRLVANSNLPIDMFDFNISYSNRQLIRQPIDFESFGFPVPSSASFELGSLGKISSLSSFFPMTPQIPFNQLPYSREGISNLTLASISSTVYVEKNSSFVPFYQSDYLIALLYLVDMSAAWILVRKFND
ncbi:MAG: alkaline phosphatase family protein [Conexivisphaerales archaeon]